MQRLFVVVISVLCYFSCYASDYVAGPEEKAKLALMQERLSGGAIEQNEINETLAQASGSGYKILVEFLLNFQDTLLRPNQVGINNALCSAIAYNQESIIRFLVNIPEDQLRPDQESIISAYRNAIAEEQVDTMRSHNFAYLFCKRRLASEQSQILHDYRSHNSNVYSRIVHMLAPFVPEEERRNQIRTILNSDSELAHEIHKYVDTEVKINADDLLDLKQSKPVKLIDAVWGNIVLRISKVSTTYAEAKKVIEESIAQFIPKSQQKLAKEAVFFRLISDVDYEEQLTTAIDFIQKFHVNKMQQWLEGFVRESIEAYKDSISSTSCNKGIKERIVTGFRGIDEDLDELFKQAEAPMLFKNWLKMWDLTSISDASKQKLVEQLKARGIDNKSSVALVVDAFKKIANKQLEADGLQNDKDLQSEVETYAESMIEVNYEVMLKPFLK